VGAERGREGEAEPLTEARSLLLRGWLLLMGTASLRHTQGQAQAAQPQPQSQPKLEEADAQQAQMLLQMQRLLAAGPLPPGPGTAPEAGEEGCKENLRAGEPGGLGARCWRLHCCRTRAQGRGLSPGRGCHQGKPAGHPGAERTAETLSACPGPSDCAPGTPHGEAGAGAGGGALGAVSGAELVRRMDAQEQRVESLLSSFAATAARLERSMAAAAAPGWRASSRGCRHGSS